MPVKWKDNQSCAMFTNLINLVNLRRPVLTSTTHIELSFYDKQVAEYISNKWYKLF